MRWPASGNMAANVVRRAEFAAANLGQSIPYLRFETDACPASPDAHIAHHERAVSLRIFVWSRETIEKGRIHGTHPCMRRRVRYTTVETKP